MRTACLSAVLGLALAGCGPIDQPRAAPKAGPPPPPPHVAALAALAGDWIGTDRDTWQYVFHVDADGTFTQTIARGGLGTCEQQGKLALDPQVSGPEAPAGQAIGVTYQKNTCVVSSYPGMAAIAELRAFGDGLLELHFTDGSIHYQRAAAPAAR